MIIKCLPIVKIPTSSTTNKPTNFTDMEPTKYLKYESGCT